MFHFPIGVMTCSFRVELPIALKNAAALNAQGVQIAISERELVPEKLNSSRRKEILDMIKSNGLVVSALCGDLGMAFDNPVRNADLIERSKRILDLAKDLETNVVTTHIGVAPKEKTHPRYAVMQDACGQLSEYADSLNAHFAIETGPETAAVLKEFLDSLHSKGVAVNLDPANLVMVTGDDPVRAVYTLKDYIVHTHAKDGRQLIMKDPELIYGIIEDEIDAQQAFIELPLGQGDVDFPNYLKALDDIGYRGFLTIEREVGDDPDTDIRTAVHYLKGLM